MGQADDIARADGRDVLTFDQALRVATGSMVTAPVGKLTVRQALDGYFIRLAARSKHAGEYRGAAGKHIVPTLGDYRVDRLSKTQIENWLTVPVKEALALQRNLADTLQIVTQDEQLHGPIRDEAKRQRVPE